MSEFDPNKLPFFQREKVLSPKSYMDFFSFSVEVAADEVFLMKADSEIVYVNQSACERLGYARDELIGKYVWEWDPLFPKEAWPGFWEEFVEARHVHFETRHRTREGVEFPVEIHGHLFRQDDEPYILAFVTDLTEKKRIEQALIDHQEKLEELVRIRTAELEKVNTDLERVNADLEKVNADLELKRREAEVANEAKSQFLSTITHELRTPLTSIKGALALLVNDVISDPDRVHETLDLAYRNSERLEVLVNDVLDFEKLRHGEVRFRDEPLDLVRLARDSVDLLKGFANRYSVALELEPGGPESLPVLADPSRVAQVISNLVSNAIKFSPEGGTVSLRLEARQGKAHLGVKDCGDGIPEEARSKLFRYFSQLDSSDTREKGGTGLGLAISKTIIDHYQGVIDFRSSPATGGAYFYFELPLSTASY